MNSALPSAIADDLATKLMAKLAPSSVTGDQIQIFYGPPEGAPASLQCWVRYKDVGFEWGLFLVPHPEISVVVGVRRGGQYQDEYRLVTDVAHEIATAIATIGLRDRALLAGEAPITGVAITEAREAVYAGDPLMAAEITIDIENKEINLT